MVFCFIGLGLGVGAPNPRPHTYSGEAATLGAGEHPIIRVTTTRLKTRST